MRIEADFSNHCPAGQDPGTQDGGTGGTVVVLLFTRFPDRPKPACSPGNSGAFLQYIAYLFEHLLP